MPATKTPAQPTEDALADVRAAFGVDDEPALAAAPETPGPMVGSQDAQDDVRTTIVAAWHLDTTATGFLHRGGSCGCRYLAGLAVQVAIPVIQENETSGE